MAWEATADLYRTRLEVVTATGTTQTRGSIQNNLQRVKVEGMKTATNEWRTEWGMTVRSKTGS
jgi:hypothetical protein